MSSSPPEVGRVRRMFRRKAKPGSPASPRPDRPPVESAAPPSPAHDGARIGRITSSFHLARLAAWEVPLHPNRIDDVLAGVDALVIDASAALGASVWAGLGGPAASTATRAVEAIIAAVTARGGAVVFRWDLGAGAQAETQLIPLAGRAALQVAAPHSPRADDLPVLPHGVAGAVFTAGGSHDHGLGMLASDALAGWTDPAPDAEAVPDHASTIGPAALADPHRLATWLGTIRTLALPQPLTPLTYQLGAEAIACGVILDDEVSAEVTTHQQVRDELEHLTAGAT